MRDETDKQVRKMSQDSDRLSEKRGKLEELKRRKSESVEKYMKAKFPEEIKVMQGRPLDNVTVEMRIHQKLVEQEISELKREVSKVYGNEKLVEIGGEKNS